MSRALFDNLQPVSKWRQPQLFTVVNEADLSAVLELIEEGRVTQFFDPMAYAIEELYDIAYPHEKDLPITQKIAYDKFAKQHDWPKGVFVYFPWNRTLVRFPSKEELRALRTSRNRNLITTDEQKKLYDSTIFVAGLSVGSNIVEALVSMGIGGRFILADMDIIEPSNLNRIRAPYQDVGVHKADAVAMRMSQIDPYLDFVLYRDGVTADNLVEMLEKDKPDILIDEMDQVQLKIRLRQEAKSRGLAVLSAADDGDSALLDIERYDVDQNYPLYHGLIPQGILDKLESVTDIPRESLGLLIGKYFVGADHIPLRMFQSLGEVGKTLPSWPQLGGAAAQSGIAIAYAARQILLGASLKQGRFVIGPDQVLQPAADKTSQQALGQYKMQLNKFKLQ